MRNPIFFKRENKSTHFSGLWDVVFIPLSVLFFLLMGLSWMSSAQNAKSVNNINGGMPNRISMNVTVAKQTQGATFGEKVNAGLHAAGGALAQGASLVGAALPGGSILSAALSKTNSEDKEWEVKNQGNGFTLPEKLEPGDYFLTIVVSTETGENDILRTTIRLGILSGENGGIMAVSSQSGLAGGAGGGAAAASYAATGRSAHPSVMGDKGNQPPINQEPSMKSESGETYYSIYINGVEYDMVRVKTRHDTVKNSINNVR